MRALAIRAPRSLTARVLLVATTWAIVALIVIAFTILQLYRQSAESAFVELLRAQLYNVIDSISVSANGSLVGAPQLGDLRFTQPQSGWYWIVEPLGDFTAAPIISISLGVGSVAFVPVGEVAFDARYQRAYPSSDSFGNAVFVVETEVELDEEGRAARFRIVGNRDATEADIARFSRQLVISLVLFGIGSLLVNAGAILFGLKPLDAARRALERIRAGESTRLEGEFPREIAPLAEEVNALIESNRRIVERARMQVGNLAHSLKTPIAVLLNEARRMTPEHRDLVETQAGAMQAQVQTYLDRARIVAERGSILTRTEPRPVLQRLVRVMARLNPDLDFSLNIETDAMLAVESQDLEEIVGNLLENAAKFATKSVRVVVAGQTLGRADTGSESNDSPQITIAIEDDGPGLDEAQIAEALKRGRRLDETKPGTGLGLSIVREITGEYDGMLSLSRGAGGGLKAMVTLPAV